MLSNWLHHSPVDPRSNVSSTGGWFLPVPPPLPISAAFLNKPEPGKMEKRALRAGIFSVYRHLHADMRKQTGQQRNVNFAIIRRFAVNRNAVLSPLAQLGVDILPFAHAQIVEIMVRHRRRKAFEESAFAARQDNSTDSQMPKSTLCRKRRCFFVSCLPLVHRTLARILNGRART